MLDLYQQPPNRYKSIAAPTWDGAFPTPDTIGNQGSPTRNFIKQGVGGLTTGAGPNAINDMVAQRLLAQHSPIQADAMAMWKQQHGVTGYSSQAPSSTPGATQGSGGHPSYGMGGGGGTGAPIHGYIGGGIPTDLFAQLTGRGATADDYYGMQSAGGANPYGGIGVGHTLENTPFPTGPALGAGDSSYNTLPSTALTDLSKGHPDYKPASDPFTRPSIMGVNIPDWDFKADGGPLTVGKPTVVGERGPEMIVPTKDSTVIPNHYLPMQYLMNGDILGYIKSLQK